MQSRRPSYHIENLDEEYHHSKLGVHSFGLWLKDKYTDVTVKLNGQSFRAHRPVLTCYSTYFKEHLSNPNKNKIRLDDLSITTESFEILLYFMYTGRLEITVLNIGDVYIASQKLGILKALNLCEDILLGKVNREVQCLYLYVTAKKLRETEGARKALEVMAWNFEQIVGTKEFLDLQFDEVMEYLSFDHLACRSEIIVYLAALRWLNYNFLEREIYIEPVIGCVRFPLMTLNEIMACFSPPLLPGIVEIPAIEYMLLTATCYIASKTVDEQKRLKKYACRPRQYLNGRSPVILWDSNIFDPTRHSQYRRETAATTIQSGYRGHIVRCDNKHLQNFHASAPKIGGKGVAIKPPVVKLEKQAVGLKSPTKNPFMPEKKPIQKTGVTLSPIVGKTSFISQPFITAQFDRRRPYDKNMLSDNVEPTTQSPLVPQLFERSPSNKNISGGDKVNKNIIKKAKVAFKSMNNENLPNYKQSPATKVTSLENILSGKKEINEFPQREVKRNFVKQQQPYRPISSPLSESSYISESDSNKNIYGLVKSWCENCCRQVNMPSEMCTSEICTSDTETSSVFSATDKGTLSESSLYPTHSRKENLSPILKQTNKDDDQSYYPEECTVKTNKDMIETTVKIVKGDRTARVKIQKYRSFYESDDFDSNNPKTFVSEEDRLLMNTDRNAKGKIILLGGYNPNNSGGLTSESCMFQYDPIANEWGPFGKMPVHRHHMVAVYYDFCIYIIGGSNVADTTPTSSIPTSDCRKYQLSRNKWVTIDSMTHPRMYHGAAAVKNIIYAVGGVDNGGYIMDSIECYSAVDDAWQLLKYKLKMPKMGVGVCEYQNNLWIAGGMNNIEGTETFTLFGDIEVYNPRTNAMEKGINDLPSPRCYVSLVACDGHVYCIGGGEFLNGKYQPMSSLKDVCVYVNDADLWVRSSPLPNPGHSISTVKCGRVIYAMNGLSTLEPGMLRDIVLKYDPSEDTWSFCTPIPVLYDGVSAVCVPK